MSSLDGAAWQEQLRSLRILSPERALSVSLAGAFPQVDHQRPDESAVVRHVVWWLHAWSDEPEDRVRRLVDIKVAGWPRIGVEITARCAGGDRLLAAVRERGGVMDL